jgi:hypothetical protein
MNRPAPYPADTKAKGWRFELDYEAIEQSDTWSLAAEVPMAQHALVLMWLVAWTQIPCGSFPADEAIIRAKCKVPAKDWARLRDVLMRGWWLADDGRMYHDTISQRVLEMLEYRRKESDRRDRNRKKPPPDTAALRATTTGQTEVSHVCPAGQPQDTTVTPDTGTGTGTIGEVIGTHTADASGDFLGPQPGVRETNGERPAHAKTPTGQVCIAMKRAGIGDVNPSNQKLMALIEAGATVEEFTDAAAKAVKARKGFAYALGIVEGVRREAKDMADQILTGALPAAPPPMETFRERDARLAAERVAQFSPGMARRDVLIEQPRTIFPMETIDVPLITGH